MITVLHHDYIGFLACEEWLGERRDKAATDGGEIFEDL